jgi:O-antigen ligase
LVLSTVFILNDDLADGVISGKYFWFYSSVGILNFIVFVVVLIKKTDFCFSILDGLLLLFVGSIYIPAFLFIFNETNLNISKLSLFSLLIVLYFSFRLLVNTFTQKDIVQDILCIFIISTGLIEALWGLKQLHGFEKSQHALFRLTGSFFNPGPYAGYLAMTFPLALHYCINKTREMNKYLLCVVKHISAIFACITCIVIIIVLPSTMSRASWLSVITGSVVVVYPYYFERFRKFYLKYKKGFRLIYCTVFICLLSALLGMYFLKKDSADGRVLIWEISLQTVMKHPFGVGLGNFPGAYGEMQAAYFASGQATETEQLVAGNPEYGFNEYLQIAVESGIIALILFIAIIVIACRFMLRAKAWGLLGALISLSVFAFFSYPFSVLPFLILFTFLIAASQWNTKSSDNRSVRVWRVKPAMTAGISVILLFVTSFYLWKQYPVYQAYRQWKTNQMYLQAGLFKGTAENYEALYPFLDDQIRFLFEYAQCLSKSEEPEKSNRVLQRAMQISCDPMLYNIAGKNYQAMQQYEQAEIAFVRATQLVPSRLYPWYLLTKLYIETGQKEKAAETAKMLLTKEPKVQSPAVREMREEVRKLQVEN